MDPIDRLFELLERGAARLYGGGRVSRLEHALQCATLAERTGAAPPLVAAALFHDLGGRRRDPPRRARRISL